MLVVGGGRSSGALIGSGETPTRTERLRGEVRLSRRDVFARGDEILSERPAAEEFEG